MRWRIVTLVVFALVFSVLQVTAYRQKSATWDEPIHLTTGYVALARQDYRVEGTHPPFLRMWAAVPLLFMSDVRVDTSIIDRTDPVAWISGSPSFDFSTKFLYLDNDADRLLNAARFMIVIWGIVLGVLVWCWTYEWLGPVPARWALVFFTLSPNLLANTSLVTTDGGIACFMFGTVYFLWRTTRRVSAGNLIGLTVFFILGIVTKFSALTMGPLVAVLLIVAVVRRTAVTARTAVAIVVLLAVASYVAVWAVHGFRYAPSPSPGWELHVDQLPLARTLPVLADSIGWIDRHRLLPNMFSQGFLVFAQSMTPPNWTFLAGEYSPDGWWYYFPFAFLIKTPIAFMALIAIGLAVGLRRRLEGGVTTGAVVLISVAIYLAFAIANTFQVGIRHILPVYAFLVLVAAAATVWLIARRAGRLTLAGLLGLWIFGLASSYPYTLTFFNLFVGGPANGYKYLADSNVDWGQGLKLLKQWMDREGVDQVGLAYFGTADPGYYGIDYTLLPAATPGYDLPSRMRPWSAPELPGYVAVSATVLTGVYLDPEWRVFYQGLRDMEPVDVLGNSIFVYRLDRWPEGDGDGDGQEASSDAHLRLADALAKAEWFDHAVVHYRDYLETAPDDASALTRLGMTLVAAEKPAEAIPVLDAAIGRAPDDGVAHLMLGAAHFDARQSLDAVVEHARRAAVLRPLDPSPLVLLARARAVRGQFREAAALLDRALVLSPGYEEAIELRQAIARARATKS